MDGKNPYIEARRQWNEAYGDLVMGKRNWQVACGVASLIAVILAIGLVSVSLQAKVVPYVVEVDKAGYALGVGPAEQVSIKNQNLVRYQLARFIRNSRAVSHDPVALKALLDEAYSYVKGGAIQTLNEYYQENDPFDAGRDSNSQVDIVSLLPLSEDAWQVRWREVRRNLNGEVIGRSNWEALLNTSIELPKSPAEVVKNPLGLYVVNLSWTEQL